MSKLYYGEKMIEKRIKQVGFDDGNKEQDKLWAGKYYVIGKRDLYTGENCSMVLDCAKESMGTEL